MALPFSDPSQFVTFDGPNGPVAIPNDYAGSFQLAPPPLAPPPTATGPLPTFDPAELAPPVAPVPQPTDPTTPVPSAFGAPPVPQSQPFMTPEEAAQLPPPQQAPMPAPPARQQPQPAKPMTALDVAMAANRNRQDIAQEKGDVESRAATAEQGIYEASDKREAAAEKVRQAEREKEAKERERARAEIKDASDRAANYKIDENRRWSNLSTPRKILAGIGVLLSGLGNALAKKGGAANPALDYIMETLKEDTRLQMDERAQLGAQVGQKKDAYNDLRAQFSDNEAAFQAQLASNAKFVANKLRASAAQAKSESAKLNGLEAAAELDQQSATLLSQAEEREYSRKIDDRNYRLAASGQALQNQKFKRDKFESDRSYEEGKRRWEAEQDVKAQEAQAAAETARAKGNEADAKALEKEAEKAKKEADEIRNLSIGAGTRTVVAGPDGKPTVQYEPLKDREGKVWKAPDKLAEPLQKKKGSVDNLVKLMDDTVNLIDQHGWEPDFLKTDAGQQLQANWASMAIDEKTIAELGVLAGPDMALIAKKLGTGDPTSWIDQTAGIRKARQNTLDKFDSDLRGAGYDGARYDIPEMTKGGVEDATKNTTVGELNAKAKGRESGQSFSPRVVSRNLTEAASGKRGQFAASEAQPTAEAETAINSLFTVALNGTAQSQPMAKRALQVMMNDPNPSVRAYVREKAKAMPSLGLEVPAK